MALCIRTHAVCFAAVIGYGGCGVRVAGRVLVLTSTLVLSHVPSIRPLRHRSYGTGVLPHLPPLPLPKKLKYNFDSSNSKISLCESLLNQFPSLTRHRGADKCVVRPTSRCILFDGGNISFDASLVIYNNNNIPPIMIINRIYDHQNLLSL
jgi:hypothetical protein